MRRVHYTVTIPSPDLLETVAVLIFPNSRRSGIVKVQNFFVRNKLVRKIIGLGFKLHVKIFPEMLKL